MKSINITPSWPAAISTWFMVLENCKPSKRKEVIADMRIEVMRLAEAYEELQVKHDPAARKFKRQLAVLKGGKGGGK